MKKRAIVLLTGMLFVGMLLNGCENTNPASQNELVSDGGSENESSQQDQAEKTKSETGKGREKHTTASYDDYANMQIVLGQRMETGKWEAVNGRNGEAEIVYDEQGNYTKITLLDADSQIYQTLEFAYDGGAVRGAYPSLVEVFDGEGVLWYQLENTLNTSGETMRYAGKEGKDSSGNVIYTCEYEEDGSLESSHMDGGLFGDWALILYAEDGSIDTVDGFNLVGDREWQMIYEYKDDGQIEDILFARREKLRGVLSTEFNEEGKLISAVNTLGIANKMLASLACEYDGAGNVSKVIWEADDSRNSKEFTYVYDDTGRRIQCMYYHDGSTRVFDLSGGDSAE